jgi:hypothetical protein
MMVMGRGAAVGRGSCGVVVLWCLELLDRVCGERDSGLVRCLFRYTIPWVKVFNALDLRSKRIIQHLINNNHFPSVILDIDHYE